MRQFIRFSLKEANLRICSEQVPLICREVVRLRQVLEGYIDRQPEFRSSLVPIQLLSDAPEICYRMARASFSCGVGPMAAVAGAVAQLCAEAALAGGASQAIIENGGDIYVSSTAQVVVGLYAGNHPLSGKLALALPPGRLPIAVCSSSGRFGHSLSLGDCDLATIVARDGALADAAATLAANSVKTVSDVEPTLQRIMGIDGIDAVLIIQEDRVGVAGNLPELLRAEDPEFAGKACHVLEG